MYVYIPYSKQRGKSLLSLECTVTLSLLLEVTLIEAPICHYYIHIFHLRKLYIYNRVIFMFVGRIYIYIERKMHRWQQNGKKTIKINEYGCMQEQKICLVTILL